MKKWILALSAPLALSAQPLWAQDEDSATEDAEVMAAMMQAFAVEPLSAEEEARLPLAQQVIDKMMPEGSMQKVIDSTFGGMLGPFMDLAAQAGPSLADTIGYDESELEVTDEQVKEIASIIDPNWQERQRREMAFVKDAMGEVMAAMEPAMRKGMSEAYAVAFTATELNDLNAFFATPSGSTFAAKSFELANDPRIMSAAMSSMPVMMEQFATMEEKMKAAMADLPERRTYSALSAQEKARLQELTGLSEEDLVFGMEVAVETAAQDTPF
ncbi:DUF2059 domain-containing protein [Qipengyuania aquimaris]|uniref:DUF2059 domain-containing protein n=1 Tax=Qipengyuania aquimaris TaxID=255984 RepID=UPI001CD2DAC5|nr:DUF2059 domain-containing protein [Qipengyuania aquimaris]MCA0903558.1 DUF2059 domain-containing protein [Qipengyuania aquimaris]